MNHNFYNTTEMRWAFVDALEEAALNGQKKYECPLCGGTAVMNDRDRYLAAECEDCGYWDRS